MQNPFVRAILAIVLMLVMMFLMSVRLDSDINEEIIYDCNMNNLPLLVEEACKKKQPQPPIEDEKI